MRATLCATLALVVAGLSSGCVTRRVLITSDPPGALVYRDGQPLGPTPVEQPFVYYGKYRYRLVKDGYQPLDVEPELVPPFYQWAGIDFVTENLIPFTFRDTQVVHLQLAPLEAVRHDDVRARAEELRGQGTTIGPPPGVQPRRSSKSGSVDGNPVPVEIVGAPVPLAEGNNQGGIGQPLPNNTPGTQGNASQMNALPVRKTPAKQGFATSPTPPVTLPSVGPSQ